MPRACVIVLDAVGAGALPDQADYGDEGSDTLGNVARAVGGLHLPNLERLGLGRCRPILGLSATGQAESPPSPEGRGGQGVRTTSGLGKQGVRTTSGRG